MIKRFKCDKIVTLSGIISGYVYTVDEKISYVGSDELPFDEELDLSGKYLLPGFVELHTHGAGGNPFLTKDKNVVKMACDHHLRHGTTTILPTLSASPIEVIEESVMAIKEARDEGLTSANIIGAHIEGPYLAPEMCGAIVIACADRNIVNYLNNESASAKAKSSRYDLQNILCNKVKTDENGNYKWVIRKPWESFTQDVYHVLENMVVSFKQNLRVINKASNTYIHIEDGKKCSISQKGLNWSIRKPMHKDTIFGEVNLRKIKIVSFNEAVKNPSRIVNKDFKKELLNQLTQVKNAKMIKKHFEDNKDVWQDVILSKIPVYYFTKETNDRFFATRKALDSTFDKKRIEESVTDTGIQKILLRHLEQNNNDADIAFSPDGIDRMNLNIQVLNGGKFHQPIYKVRVYEKAEKFAIGTQGNKSSKFVEGAKGTNLYFAVYEAEVLNEATGKVTRKRNYATIPLSVVIDRQKQGLPPAPADQNGNDPIFVLSPNDLVYVPEDGWKIGDALKADRIYKMVSAGGYVCFFVKHNVAKSIVDKYEFSSQNKMERALTGEMIKQVCVPIRIDRLGNIIKIGYE